MASTSFNSASPDSGFIAPVTLDDALRRTLRYEFLEEQIATRFTFPNDLEPEPKLPFKARYILCHTAIDPVAPQTGNGRIIPVYGLSYQLRMGGLCV